MACHAQRSRLPMVGGRWSRRNRQPAHVPATWIPVRRQEHALLKGCWSMSRSKLIGTCSSVCSGGACALARPGGGDRFVDKDVRQPVEATAFPFRDLRVIPRERKTL